LNKMVDIDRCSTRPVKMILQKQFDFETSSNFQLSVHCESLNWIGGVSCQVRCVNEMNWKIERVHWELFKSRKKSIKRRMPLRLREDFQVRMAGQVRTSTFGFWKRRSILAEFWSCHNLSIVQSHCRIAKKFECS
jgi:hypothetical protein